MKSGNFLSKSGVHEGICEPSNGTWVVHEFVDPKGVIPIA